MQKIIVAICLQFKRNKAYIATSCFIMGAPVLTVCVCKQWRISLAVLARIMPSSCIWSNFHHRGSILDTKTGPAGLDLVKNYLYCLKQYSSTYCKVTHARSSMALSSTLWHTYCIYFATTEWLSLEYLYLENSNILLHSKVGEGTRKINYNFLMHHCVQTTYNACNTYKS